MFEQVFKNIDDILHKDAGCSSELDYVEQASWILFLKYRDDLAELVKLQASSGSAAYDLSVKNPNKKDETVLREPKEILAEISKLDIESA